VKLSESYGPAGLSRFGEDRWDLSPLSRRHHEAGRTINWDAFPAGPRASFKRAGWALLNLPTPAELLERAATARAEHPSTGTIAAVTQNWRRYAAWLTARGITSLAQVDSACHEQYAAHVARLPLAARTQAAALSAVSVLWGFAPHLPSGDRIPMPPWEAEGLRHYLPAAQGRNENATAPVHPAVMSPLLVWALRFAEDFAGDILAALAEHQRLRSQIAPRTSPAAGARLRALLDEHARTGSPLPGGHAGNSHRAARSYLAAITGGSLSQASNILRDYGRLPVAGPALLDVPVTGLVHGKPWTSGIGYHEAQELAMCLATACLIVVTYLSGLRPAEALHLRTGCCPAPAPDHARTVRYTLAGDYFKGATTGDGTPAPDGAPRQWTVIPPVHTAVMVLEQLTTTQFLFPLRPAWPAGTRAAAPHRRTASPGTHGHRRRRGEVITAKAANYRIADFITWVNDYARQHGLDAEAIPADPDGPVTISRFRRTIAWHIARLPGGRIALAIQYGHMRTSPPAKAIAGVPATAWPASWTSRPPAPRPTTSTSSATASTTARPSPAPLPTGCSTPPAPPAPGSRACSCPPARSAPCSPTPHSRSTTTRTPSWPATTTRPGNCATPAAPPGPRAAIPAWTGATRPAPTSPAPTPTSPPCTPKPPGCTPRSPARSPQNRCATG
jgi:hypothetical protein